MIVFSDNSDVISHKTVEPQILTFADPPYFNLNNTYILCADWKNLENRVIYNYFNLLR